MKSKLFRTRILVGGSLFALAGVLALSVRPSHADAMSAFRRAVSSGAYMVCYITCYDCSLPSTDMFARYFAPLVNDPASQEHDCQAGANPCYGCDLQAAAVVPELSEAIESGNDAETQLLMRKLGGKVELNRARHALQVRDCVKDLVLASIQLNDRQVALAEHVLVGEPRITLADFESQR